MRLFGVIASLILLVGCTTKSTSSLTNFEGTTSVNQKVDSSKAAAQRVVAARAYLQSQSLERAKFHLDKAREHDDDYPDLYYTLGFYYQLAGQRNNADKAFRRALSLDRRNPEYKNAYGQFLCNGGEFAKAEDYYQAAIATPTYSNIVQAYFNLGICKLKQSETKEAMTLFRKALNINPKFPAALLEMAELEYLEKRYQRTSSYLSRFREVAGPNPRSLWLGLRSSYFLGDKDAVSSYGLKLEQLFPDSEQTAQYLDNQSNWQ